MLHQDRLGVGSAGGEGEGAERARGAANSAGAAVCHKEVAATPAARRAGSQWWSVCCLSTSPQAALGFASWNFGGSAECGVALRGRRRIRADTALVPALMLLLIVGAGGAAPMEGTKHQRKLFQLPQQQVYRPAEPAETRKMASLPSASPRSLLPHIGATSFAHDITTPQLAVTGGGMLGGWEGAPTTRQSNVFTAQQRQKALVVADPSAPSALNSFADGQGVREAEVGKVARFHVVARDMYGEEHQCDPDSFVVNVVWLSAAFDENEPGRCTQSVSLKCTTCQATTACYDGLVDGKACGYTFTPRSPGFYRISILTPSQTSDRLVNIQGSPYRVHADDGGLFLPGVSVWGYLSFFVVGVAGVCGLLFVLLAAISSRATNSPPASEYADQITRLENLAQGLEETAQRRRANGSLMRRLPGLMQALGGVNASGYERSDDEDEDHASISAEAASTPTLDLSTSSWAPINASAVGLNCRYSSPGKRVCGGEGVGSEHREEYLSEAVYHGVSGLVHIATPMKHLTGLLVDEGAMDTTQNFDTEMQLLRKDADSEHSDDTSGAFCPATSHAAIGGVVHADGGAVAVFSEDLNDLGEDPTQHLPLFTEHRQDLPDPHCRHESSRLHLNDFDDF